MNFEERVANRLHYRWMPAAPRVLRIYVTPDGKRPFEEWMYTLKDVEAQGSILARLELVRPGLLGDCKSVGEGVSEFRVDVGLATASTSDMMAVPLWSCSAAE